MEWHLGLDGRSFADLEAKKQKIAYNTAPTTDQAWCALAGVALEVIGLRLAVRLGDPRLWRQAVSELDTLPLSPLNLPLPLWDLYQAHPFDGVTLHMQDGQQIDVPDWSKLYYSWHSRWFAVAEEKMVKFFDGTQISGGESAQPPAAQTTILERLQWLQRAEKPIDFVVRTRQGVGFIVLGKNGFRLDPSGALLVYKRSDDQPVEILPVTDIVSIVLANPAPKVLLEKLQQHLKATPFLPFQILLFHGRRYTVVDSKDVLVASENLYLAQGGTSADTYDEVLEIPLSWIDRFEALPS